MKLTVHWKVDLIFPLQLVIHCHRSFWTILVAAILSDLKKLQTSLESGSYSLASEETFEVYKYISSQYYCEYIGSTKSLYYFS